MGNSRGGIGIQFYQIGEINMLRVIVNDGDKIERSLKQFKRKCNNTKLIQECRKRQQFEKPSVTRRNELIKAKYIQSLKDMED